MVQFWLVKRSNLKFHDPFISRIAKLERDLDIAILLGTRRDSLELLVMMLRLALHTKQSVFIFVFILTALIILIPETAEFDYESPQVVQAAPGQDVIDLILLEASSPSSITIAPSNIELGALDPGVTYSQQGTLDVKGTGHWIVTVSSDGQPKKGYMSEYDPESSQYIGPNGKQLTNSMTIQAFEKGILVGQIDLKTGGQLVQGEGRKSYTIFIYQTAAWDDESLAQNHIYRMAVTFTGT